jgi:hypothetical protein
MPRPSGEVGQYNNGGSTSVSCNFVQICIEERRRRFSMIYSLQSSGYVTLLQSRVLMLSGMGE